MEEFYLEQQTYIERFDWDYISHNLEMMINDKSFLVLVDDNFKSFMIGHISHNLLLPIVEACEDYIYITKSHRGGTLFPKILSTFEKWCLDNGANYNDVGTGTGIDSERVRKLYSRYGYKEYRYGFKKEIKQCAVAVVDAGCSK